MSYTKQQTEPSSPTRHLLYNYILTNYVDGEAPHPGGIGNGLATKGTSIYYLRT
ncbi:Uncharacterised protein [Mycobacteroides abscessus subsp. abscessus]|nr:Uncharacterised protein [Mycobacteroides abscessus subsp. abscessus]